MNKLHSVSHKIAFSLVEWRQHDGKRRYAKGSYYKLKLELNLEKCIGKEILQVDSDFYLNLLLQNENTS